MDCATYLQRIGFPEIPAVNQQTLRQLHAAHIEKIPFETLDIYSKKRFTLALPDLYDKIVARRRGGYCYELSGLFFYLLKELGFEVSIHCAHLFDSRGAAIPTSQHMVLIVKLEEFWLADVGYGNGFIEPLQLDNLQPQLQGHRVFRCLQKDGKTIVQELSEGVWNSWYVFAKDPKKVADFEDRNRYHQTSKESVFFRKRICMIARADETVELNGNVLTKQRPQGSSQKTMGEEELPLLLKTEFGISL